MGEKQCSRLEIGESHALVTVQLVFAVQAMRGLKSTAMDDQVPLGKRLLRKPLTAMQASAGPLHWTSRPPRRARKAPAWHTSRMHRVLLEFRHAKSSFYIDSIYHTKHACLASRKYHAAPPFFGILNLPGGLCFTPCGPADQKPHSQFREGPRKAKKLCRAAFHQTAEGYISSLPKLDFAHMRTRHEEITVWTAFRENSHHGCACSMIGFLRNFKKRLSLE